MSDFIAVMNSILQLFKIEINIYGFSFSLWNVLIVSVLGTILLNFISGVINDE